jgi:hypothetical protein
MRWAGYVTRMRRRGMNIGSICGKARRKETTRKTRTTWVDNTKIGLREIGRDGMD